MSSDELAHIVVRIKLLTTIAEVSIFWIVAFACVLFTNAAYNWPGNGAMSSVYSASPVHYNRRKKSLYFIV